jgi:hypothetical protein
MEPIVPSTEQCKTLYRVCNELTMEYGSTIDLVRIDERTRSLVVLYGQEGYLEIDSAGVLIPEGGAF